MVVEGMKMHETTRPSSTGDDALERFRRMVEGFNEGRVSAAELQAHRVPLGVYEQREDGRYMVRLRLPAGKILPRQMRVIANTARRFGSDVLHVTTRQGIQLHRLSLDDVHEVLVALRATGLSTRGSGGNTVRNVTACWQAGVCPRQAFDVSAYPAALTQALLRMPMSDRLPRKLKLAFSGCGEDCAGARVQDLGFVAAEEDGRRGFAVYAGGGLGAKSAAARPLLRFVPAAGVERLAEALIRVFDERGNRRNKRRARLRFLVEEAGIEQFGGWIEGAIGELRGAREPIESARVLGESARPAGGERRGDPADAFGIWRARNTFPQDAADLWTVLIPLHLGDIGADALDTLADVAETHGAGAVRLTQSQNAALLSVPERSLPALHRALDALGLAATSPPLLRDMVTCAGATTCRPGICNSRALADALREALPGNGIDLEALGALKLHISGCPNACGRHPTADIGLFGGARRVDGRPVPAYVVQMRDGGSDQSGGIRLAEGSRTIPARRVPAFLVELLGAFRSSPHFPDFGAFLGSGGREAAGALLERHGFGTVAADDGELWRDWGATAAFSLEGRGPGECGAGVFDLIEVDLASARAALDAGSLSEAVHHGARALLVTRGREARSGPEALDLFEEEFVRTGLVEARCRRALEEARRGRIEASSRSDVAALVAGVERLYASLDDNLRFERRAGPEAPEGEPGPSEAAARSADLRGVRCPLNFVKTRMLLAGMAGGQILEVALDDEGARKVASSVEKEGHAVLSLRSVGDHWVVRIRRAAAHPVGPGEPGVPTER